MRTTLPIPHRVLATAIALLLTVAMRVPGNAQVRTVTQFPYPNKANSITWVVNVPYIPGAGPQQQLDLYLPTNQKNMPLIVYVHGGGYGHGDKMGGQFESQ
jgi:acetyl esterase/lipase